MDKMLKFLDFSCIDPHLYWRISNRAESEIFEIQWRRDDRVQWRFRRLSDPLWQLCSPEELTRKLEEQGIDSYLFEIKLKNSLLHQVTYAQRIVSDAKQLFGPEEVERAVVEHQSFMAQLEAALHRFTGAGPAKTPHLQLVKDKSVVD